MATAVLNTLPEFYVGLSEQELDERIARAKAALGSRLVILGHHYQRDEVVKFADFRGDSLKLSQLAAARPEAKYIVFCGVHFMAESADILSADHQVVMLPDLNAGCSMADMADLEQVETVLGGIEPGDRREDRSRDLHQFNGGHQGFRGRNGGAVCTSSNSQKLMEWALARGEKALFLPDEHLGRNTGYRMGIPLDQMAVWNPHRKQAGFQRRGNAESAHHLVEGTLFRAPALPAPTRRDARQAHPGIRVIAHPECSWEVCQLADEVGSTEYIIKRIVESPPGSQWAVGTEIHLVQPVGGGASRAPRLSLSTTACACAAPCIEFLPSTFAGRWKAWWKDRWSTRSRWTRKPSAGRGWRCERMLEES